LTKSLLRRIGQASECIGAYFHKRKGCILTEKEIVSRLNKIIDDIIELAIELEFGSMEEFDEHIKKEFSNILAARASKNH
jgi:hypothetical protein